MATLDELELYAKTYFPEAFEKLPSIDSLHFQPHTERSVYKIAKVKLLIGLRSELSNCRIFAYANITQNCIQFKEGNQRTLRDLAKTRPMDSKDLYEPFKHAIYYPDASGFGAELHVYLQYIFMKKGILTKLVYPQCLTRFEWACRSIANKTQAPPYTDLFSLDEHAQTNVVSCLQTPPIIPGPTPPNTSGASSKISLDQAKLGTKRPASELASGSSNKEVNDRKMLHMDMMRKMAEKRKPIEELDALKAAKADLEARIKKLEATAAQNDTAMKEVSRRHAKTVKTLRTELLAKSGFEDIKNKLQKEKDSNSAMTKANIILQTQLEVSRKNEAKAKKVIQELYRTMDTKMKKAEELYKHHRETIELFCTTENTTAGERKTVLGAFEVEFREFSASVKDK